MIYLEIRQVNSQYMYGIERLRILKYIRLDFFYMGIYFIVCFLWNFVWDRYSCCLVWLLLFRNYSICDCLQDFYKIGFYVFFLDVEEGSDFFFFFEVINVGQGQFFCNGLVD